MNEAPVEPFAKGQAEILGEDHSYPMVAYGTLKDSASWKLYAKAQNIPFEIANEISQRLKNYELAVKHADEDEKDSIDINKYIGKEYREIYDKSKDYLGIIASWSIHPCSYLIYQGSIREEIGLVRIKDHICCIMDGKWAENGHFLKQDHLKVSVVEIINKMFNSIGQEPPTINELLKMCTPDDPAWSIYQRGCCLGVNQVEKESTASRVGKFKPTNIAELTAFVAAIRPGFASLYKRFENREHFEFGIPSLDAIIQTKEYPESYLLYQENIMAVLNYAGIPLDECYTAIKNIAKKRTEKVLAYQTAFKDGFAKRLTTEGYDEDTIQRVGNQIWTTIEDAASYSFNASHAYCVALDSLYCAWFKAHYPLKFYEQYIRLQESKGDKDKINLAKEEAEDYFNIYFAPLRYGQDNRVIHVDEENGTLINTLGSIKGYGATVGRILYECSQHNHKLFTDVLLWLDQRGIKEAKYKPLILIDYFKQFGNQKELLRIASIWEVFKQGNLTNFKKSNIHDDHFRTIIEKYARGLRKDGSEAMAYTFACKEDVLNCVRECEKYVLTLKMDDVDLRTQISNSIDILGYVNVITNKESDKRKLLVMNCIPLKNADGTIWAYRATTRSLGTGKHARVTIRAKTFNELPLKEGDMVYCSNVVKNKQGYWYMTEYHMEY